MLRLLGEQVCERAWDNVANWNGSAKPSKRGATGRL